MLTINSLHDVQENFSCDHPAIALYAKWEQACHTGSLGDIQLAHSRFMLSAYSEYPHLHIILAAPPKLKYPRMVVTVPTILRAEDIFLLFGKYEGIFELIYDYSEAQKDLVMADDESEELFYINRLYSLRDQLSTILLAFGVDLRYWLAIPVEEERLTPLDEDIDPILNPKEIEPLPGLPFIRLKATIHNVGQQPWGWMKDIPFKPKLIKKQPLDPIFGEELARCSTAYLAREEGITQSLIFYVDPGIEEPFYKMVLRRKEAEDLRVAGILRREFNLS